ncbi:hypothetical protein ACTFIU_005379 [Dictyostelium citrinum]
MEVGDYSTFQSHVKSIINTQKPGTTELFMSSGQPSTFKVYDSNYSRFFSFFVFMDYLTYLFKFKPPLAYSTINSHRSMSNQLLFLKNQTDVAYDPFITRIMIGIHKLRPPSAKYNEIWDANLVFRYPATVNSTFIILKCNPIPISIPEGSTRLASSRCQRSSTSKSILKTHATVPNSGTNLLRPVLDFIEFKMKGIKYLPSMVKQGYYMILDVKKASCIGQYIDLQLRLERCTLPLEDNTIRVVDNSWYLYNAFKNSA